MNPKLYHTWSGWELHKPHNSKGQTLESVDEDSGVGRGQGSGMPLWESCPVPESVEADRRTCDVNPEMHSNTQRPMEQRGVSSQEEAGEWVHGTGSVSDWVHAESSYHEKGTVDTDTGKPFHPNSNTSAESNTIDFENHALLGHHVQSHTRNQHRFNLNTKNGRPDERRSVAAPDGRMSHLKQQSFPADVQVPLMNHAFSSKSHEELSSEQQKRHTEEAILDSATTKHSSDDFYSEGQVFPFHHNANETRTQNHISENPVKGSSFSGVDQKQSSKLNRNLPNQVEGSKIYRVPRRPSPPNELTQFDDQTRTTLRTASMPSLHIAGYQSHASSALPARLSHSASRGQDSEPRVLGPQDGGASQHNYFGLNGAANGANTDEAMNAQGVHQSQLPVRRYSEPVDVTVPHMHPYVIGADVIARQPVYGYPSMGYGRDMAGFSPQVSYEAQGRRFGPEGAGWGGTSHSGNLGAGEGPKESLVEIIRRAFPMTDSRSLFLSMIPQDMPGEMLEDILSSYGEIRKLYTGLRDIGVTVVTYYNLRDARNAFSQLQSQRDVRCCFCVTPVDPQANPAEYSAGVLVEEISGKHISTRVVNDALAGYGEVASIRDYPPGGRGVFLAEFTDHRHSLKALSVLRNGTAVGPHRLVATYAPPDGTFRQACAIFKILTRTEGPSKARAAREAPSSGFSGRVPARAARAQEQFGDADGESDSKGRKPEAYNKPGRGKGKAVRRNSGNTKGQKSGRRQDGGTQPERRGSNSTDNVCFPERILTGLDKRTSLMIRNIPNKYTQQMFLSEINEHFAGSYDFFYLPIDFRNKCNVGYAFINFIEYKTVAQFFKMYVDKEWKRFNSMKICQMNYANIQGKSELVARFQNSTVMDQPSECLPLIFFSSGPQRGSPEEFPKPSRNNHHHR